MNSGNHVSDAVREAMRLTQQGRVADATSLLQRMLSRDGRAEGRMPRAWRVPRGVPTSVRARCTPDGFAPERRAPATEPAAPGTFTARTHQGAAGARAYKVYVPHVVPPKAMPLVVMLHGCTQSPDDFAAGTRMNQVAEEQGLVVAYPAQSASANCSRCWNWFKPGDQQRDRGEPSLIAGITRDLLRDERVDPEQVYVAGLSSGGAAAATMACTYPDLFAGLGVHSGLPHGAASDMPSAFMAMSSGRPSMGDRSEVVVPTIVFHGDRDLTVHPANGDAVLAQASASITTALATTVERGDVPGGRAYTRTLHAAGDCVLFEQWVVHGAAHAWSGGSSAGTYTDPRGPDATREMLRFFRRHRRRPSREG